MRVQKSPWIMIMVTKMPSQSQLFWLKIAWYPHDHNICGCNAEFKCVMTVIVYTLKWPNMWLLCGMSLQRSSSFSLWQPKHTSSHIKGVALIQVGITHISNSSIPNPFLASFILNTLSLKCTCNPHVFPIFLPVHLPSPKNGVNLTNILGVWGACSYSYIVWMWCSCHE